MAILSFSPAPAKDTTSTVTLNKSELYALSPISGDAFWGNSSKIKRVKIIYKSTIGRQIKVLDFDASLSSPQDQISFSDKARDTFELMSVTLEDYDSGELFINRDQLSSLVVIAELDIDLT